MRIGLISDSHDDTKALKAALRRLRREGAERLIHCGDMTSVGTARLLEGWPLIYVEGNMDREADLVRQTLLDLDPANEVGVTYQGEIGPARIAVTHGHLEAEVDRLLAAEVYDYLLLGHTHRRRDERIGRTRVINPGALGGLQFESRSFGVLDLQTGTLERFELG
jgi:putative phosphoesterase